MPEPLGDSNLASSIFGGAAGNKAGTSTQDSGGAVDDNKVGAGAAGAGAADSAGQAGQDGTGGTDGGTQDKLYAKRFKTPEELEQAYREVENWGTQRAQEATALKRQLEELQAQKAPDATKKEKEDFQKAMKEAINAAVVADDPTRLVELIDRLTDKKAAEKAEERLSQIMPDLAPVIQQRKLQTEIDEFHADYPEAKAFEADMAAAIQANPNLMYDAAGKKRPDWLARTYAKVLGAKVGAVKAAAGQTKEQTTAMKQAAGTAKGGARPAQDDRTKDEVLKDSIFGKASEERKIFDL